MDSEMNQRVERVPIDDQQAAPQANSNPDTTPTRRELIERYAKYAIIAAPLVLFVSSSTRAGASTPP